MPQVEKKPKKKFEFNLSRYQTIPLKEKIIFTKNLQVMIKTGLSLSQSLKTLAKQTKNKRFQSILLDIQSNIEQGNTFASGLKKYPKVFKEIYINMVESGELSGNLEEVLDYLQIQMKKDHEIIAKVRGAMIYPSIVVIAMVGIGMAMMVFVIPKLIGIFAELNAELPLPTRILISTSDIITQNGFFVFLGAVISLILLKIFHSSSFGKKVFHAIYLKSPILGVITQKINLARFARTLSSLIKTDIPIIRSLEITSKTLGNVHYQNALAAAQEEIKKGVAISQSISHHPKLFSPMIMQMLIVGEESGEVDAVLMEVANFYEEEIDQTMKNLPQVIEPILILILGAGVGAMAIAIIMPLYSLSENI